LVDSNPNQRPGALERRRMSCASSASGPTRLHFETARPKATHTEAGLTLRRLEARARHVPRRRSRRTGPCPPAAVLWRCPWLGPLTHAARLAFKVQRELAYLRPPSRPRVRPPSLPPNAHRHTPFLRHCWAPSRARPQSSPNPLAPSTCTTWAPRAACVPAAPLPSSEQTLQRPAPPCTAKPARRRHFRPMSDLKPTRGELLVTFPPFPGRTLARPRRIPVGHAASRAWGSNCKDWVLSRVLSVNRGHICETLNLSRDSDTSSFLISKECLAES
jgi:hypothetical protein